jgi:signal transduction histidine kinase
LKNIHLQGVLTCLDAWNELSQVDKDAQRSFVNRGLFLGSLRNSQKDFEKSLENLKTYAISAKEQAEVKRLSEQWSAFNDRFNALQQQLPKDSTDFPSVLDHDLEQLKIQISFVFKASKDSIASRVQESQKTAEKSMRVLRVTTLVAIIFSILISFLIFHSISKPLANLTEGTRAIAEGKFFYRLDTSRNDEFSQLAKDFNTMTRRLGELDELKKDFVSHVSHELSVPLSSMQEIIQLLLDEIPGPLTEKQKHLLELNLRSDLRLTSMIRNLLDLSKIEAGVMEYKFKIQDLLPLVRNAVAELEVQAQEKQIRIETAFPEGLLQVECDGSRIVQVIVNLVGNAVKFSPRNGIIQVEVKSIPGIPENIPGYWRGRVGRSNNGRAFGLVTVSDTGPGIPDQDKVTVFEKFRQVRQERRITGQGIGLGLAICRTIVEAHQGAIWVEDNPGGGSRFQLLLPPREKEVDCG